MRIFFFKSYSVWMQCPDQSKSSSQMVWSDFFFFFFFEFFMLGSKKRKKNNNNKNVSGEMSLTREIVKKVLKFVRYYMILRIYLMYDEGFRFRNVW